MAWLRGISDAADSNSTPSTPCEGFGSALVGATSGHTMLATERLATCSTPRWIFGNVNYICLCNVNKVEPTLALKSRRDVTRNRKQGYQWHPNRTYECLRQNFFFFENSNNCIITMHSLPTTRNIVTSIVNSPPLKFSG